MKRTALRSVNILSVALFLGTTVIAGCSSSNGHGAEVGEVGSVGFNLSLPSGVSIDTISYTATGPNSFMKTGTINVAGSGATFTAQIDGLPPGTGYNIVLTATSADGSTNCTGGAMFDIVAHQTTSINIGLQCAGHKSTGSLLINGTVNICAVVEYANASPVSAAVGQTIVLSGLGSDEDSMPMPVSYKWTSTGGTLSGDTTANAGLTCTAAGSFVATLTVTDSDCGDKLDLNVTCTDGGAAGSGAAGVSAAGSSAAGAGGTAAGAGGTAAGTGGTAAGAGGTAAGAGGTAAGAGGTAAGAGGTAAGAGGMSVAGAGGTAAGGTSGGSDACTTCEQASATCMTRAAACDAITGDVNGVSRSTLCHNVIDCVRTTKCASATGSPSDCICGTGADVGVCATQTISQVTGACKDAIAAGAESTMLTDISTRLGDPMYATGLAIRLIQCDQNICPNDCSF